uniref:RING-type domain-containing protein n=1 Tax=Globodera pallida TaxID=36090 RepID=A0A183CTJ5_GLOPA
LPRIGFSNLSLQDLYEDRALLHDESAKPDNLCFIQFIPLKDAESNDIPNWLVLTPKRGQTLSISLDLADDLGVRVRFSFEGTGPTPWYRVRYPPYKSDFSLVIDVSRSDVLKKSGDETTLSILSSFGWLNRKLFGWDNNNNNNSRRAAARRKREEQRVEVNIALMNTELVKGECMLCYEADSDTLFYPCCHLNVHRKCLPTPTVEQCYACREKCEQLISVHQRG